MHVDQKPPHDWHGVNWKDLGPRLLWATIRILRSHPVFTGQYDLAEDLVQEACAKAFAGDRNWDPSRCSLFQFLIGIIRSELSNKTRKRITYFKCVEDIYLFYVGEYISKDFSPEGILSCEDAKKKFLLSLGKNDEDVREIAFMMFYEEIDKPEEISRKTRFTINQVNNIKKRVKRNFAKFLDSNLIIRSRVDGQITG